MLKKSWYVAILLATALLVAATPAAQAFIINFDDLTGHRTHVPNGYGGMTWSSDFWYMNGNNYPTYPNGYEPGVVSQTNIAYRAFSDPVSFSSDSKFTFNSAYFTGAWNDGLEITAKGYDGSTMMNEKTFLVDADHHTLVEFNWEGIDKVEFSSTGGIHHDAYPGHGTHFAMDDLSINEQQQVLPEPTSILIWGMMAFGMTACLWRERRASA
ncbi:MAG: hypothetical protein JXB10_02540 [Pirellulales bacterium]|nr:hypothetical protein [Pirellulales bacterium]